MNYRWYHDTESDEILSYSELKELHADLVKYQETEITEFNSYLHECVKNGCLLGAIRLEVHDIQKYTSKDTFLKYLQNKEISFYMDTWKSVYTNKGLYVGSLEDVNEFIEDFNRWIANNL